MQGLKIDQGAVKPVRVEKFVMAIRNYENFIKDSSYRIQFDSVKIEDDQITLSNFLFNTLLMRFPIEGNRVTFLNYFKGSVRNHLMGILGGGIWCLGMSFSILASDKAGPAISYGLGQGATVIAALWGIYIWKEFKDAPKGVNTMLYVMLLLYIAGLALIIMAR